MLRCVLVFLVVSCIWLNVDGMVAPLLSPVNEPIGINNIPKDIVVINDGKRILTYYCLNSALFLQFLEPQISKKPTPIVSETDSMKALIDKNRYEENLINTLSDIIEVTKNLENLQENIEHKTPEFLFLLRSALEYKCCDQNIIDYVSDKLIQNQELYYKESPYYNDLEEINKIGAYDSRSLFTLENLKRISVVLCFAKIDANTDEQSKETFDEWKKALSDILECTSDSEKNQPLLKLFKMLKAKIVDEN